MAHNRTPSYEHLLNPEDENRGPFRLGLLAAVAVHLVVFAITFPTFARPEMPETPRPSDRFELRPVVWEKPQPPVIQPQPPASPQAPPVPVPWEPTIIERRTEPVEIAPPLPFSPVVEPGPPPLPPPPTPAPTPLRAGIDVDPPVAIHRVDPRYTETARRIRFEGAVILSLLIDTDGRVADVTVLRGLPFGLTESAVTAARQWLFEPCTFNDKPVSVRMTLTVHFRIAS